MKPAFYREVGFLWSAPALPGFSLQSNVSSSESQRSHHLSPEIDFRVDTLESSHAYLIPVVASGIVSRPFCAGHVS
jgi:hypothetical protein